MRSTFINRRKWVLSILAAALLSATATPALADQLPNDLDPLFGSDGTVVTAVSGKADNSYAGDVAVQGDGKIVVAGWTYPSGSETRKVAVTRYLQDGSLDPSFGGGDGVVTTQIDSGDQIAPNEIDNLLQYGGTKVRVAVTQGGKIVVATTHKVDDSYRVAVLRYTGDGSADLGFSGDGQTVTGAGLIGGFSSKKDLYLRGLDLQSDGKIVVTANLTVTFNGVPFSQVLVARYSSSGNLDPTFDGDGRATVSLDDTYFNSRDVAVQTDGKVVVAVRSGPVSVNDPSDSHFALVRFKTNGKLDLTFGSNGKVTTKNVDSTCPFDHGGEDTPQNLSIQSDGKIVAAGNADICKPNGTYEDGLGVIRYMPNGAVDSSFGNNGRVLQIFDYIPAFASLPGASGDLGHLALSAKGNLFTASNAKSGEARLTATAAYRSSGKPHQGFGGGDGLSANTFGPQPQQLDSSYPSRINGVAVQSDEKLVVVGQVRDADGKFKFGIARYLAPRRVIGPIRPIDDENVPENPIPNPEPGPWGPKTRELKSSIQSRDNVSSRLLVGRKKVSSLVQQSPKNTVR